MSLSNVQKLKQQLYQQVVDTVVPFFGPELPPLGNATLPHLIDELGRVKAMAKDLEKVEGILKERIKSMDGGDQNARGEEYQTEYRRSERTALNQGKAKEVLSSIGRLEECMSTTEVVAMFVKEL